MTPLCLTEIRIDAVPALLTLVGMLDLAQLALRAGSNTATAGRASA